MIQEVSVKSTWEPTLWWYIQQRSNIYCIVKFSACWALQVILLFNLQHLIIESLEFWGFVGFLLCCLGVWFSLFSCWLNLKVIQACINASINAESIMFCMCLIMTLPWLECIHFPCVISVNVDKPVILLILGL